KKAQQVVKQTWFCGVHTDVGGGCKRSGLSDIALEWMITNAKTAGLEFEPDDRPPYPFNPCPTERIEDSRRGVYRRLPGAKSCAGAPPTLYRPPAHHRAQRRLSERGLPEAAWCQESRRASRSGTACRPRHARRPGPDAIIAPLRTRALGPGPRLPPGQPPRLF